MLIIGSLHPILFIGKKREVDNAGLNRDVLARPSCLAIAISPLCYCNVVIAAATMTKPNNVRLMNTAVEFKCV